MKLVEEASLQGFIFAFETDAKKAVDGYLSRAALALKGSETEKEVIADLELSIADHLREAGFSRDRAVDIGTAQAIIDKLGPVDPDNASDTQDSSDWKKWFREPFTPSRENKVIFGIAGGIAERLQIEAIWIRILFVLLAFATHGFFVVVYIAFGILLDMSKSKSPRDIAQSARTNLKSAMPQDGWRGVLNRSDIMIRKVLQAIVKLAAAIGLLVTMSLGTVLALTMASKNTDLPLIGTDRSLLAYVFVFSAVGIAFWLFALLFQTSFFPRYQMNKSIVRVLAWLVPLIILITAFATSAVYLRSTIADWAGRHPDNHFLQIDRDPNGDIYKGCLGICKNDFDVPTPPSQP